MLKIRNDVDLKELEKFGFEKISQFWYQKNIFNDTVEVNIAVTTGTREIQIAWTNRNNVVGYTYNIDVLFDLIQANLVEKI